MCVYMASCTCIDLVWTFVHEKKKSNPVYIYIYMHIIFMQSKKLGLLLHPWNMLWFLHCIACGFNCFIDWLLVCTILHHGLEFFLFFERNFCSRIVVNCLWMKIDNDYKTVTHVCKRKNINTFWWGSLYIPFLKIKSKQMNLETLRKDFSA